MDIRVSSFESYDDQKYNITFVSPDSWIRYSYSVILDVSRYNSCTGPVSEEGLNEPAW